MPIIKHHRNVYDSEIGIGNLYGSEGGFGRDYYSNLESENLGRDDLLKSRLTNRVPREQVLALRAAANNLYKEQVKIPYAGSLDFVVNLNKPEEADKLAKLQNILRVTPDSQKLSLFEQAGSNPEIRGYNLSTVMGQSRSADYRAFLTDAAGSAVSSIRKGAKFAGYGVRAAAYGTAGYGGYQLKQLGADKAQSILGGVLRKFKPTKTLRVFGGPIGLGIGIALGVASFFLSADEISILDIEEAQEECKEFQDNLQDAYDNLEDLKLGPISMEFEGSGYCEGSGEIGGSGEDYQREIARAEVFGKFSNFLVVAYSYRGYRSNDPDQGGGIDGAMSPLG